MKDEAKRAPAIQPYYNRRTPYGHIVYQVPGVTLRTLPYSVERLEIGFLPRSFSTSLSAVPKRREPLLSATLLIAAQCNFVSSQACSEPFFFMTCHSSAATGIHTLGPPKDDAFEKILQDQLAGFLGAGFRSRTNRLVAKRAASQMQPGRRGRWRGTLLELSAMELGPEQVI